jgi:4-hydroxy-2-oxoheptanedioate aldolase
MDHPKVIAAIKEAVDQLKLIDVPVGLMALDPDTAQAYIASGVDFTAVGVDLVLLADSVAALRQRFDPSTW